jgi:CBS domain-containing protein
MSSSSVPTHVRDLMVRDVITVEPEDPLSEAIALMYENRVTAVPVVDRRGRCRGILSTSDLVGPFFTQTSAALEPDELGHLTADLANAEQREKRLGKRKVSEIMTADVFTVAHEDTIQTAAREMLRNRVHRLVVADSQQRVIGILSTMDLLEAFLAAS